MTSRRKSLSFESAHSRAVRTTCPHTNARARATAEEPPRKNTMKTKLQKPDQSLAKDSSPSPTEKPKSADVEDSTPRARSTLPSAAPTSTGNGCETDASALDLSALSNSGALTTPILELVIERYTKSVDSCSLTAQPMVAPPWVQACSHNRATRQASFAATHAAQLAERRRQDSEVVALAHSWIARVGLKLPLDDYYVDRFWPLEANDVELAFLYYFAARAQAVPDTSALFAGIRVGAPRGLACAPNQNADQIRERGHGCGARVQTSSRPINDWTTGHSKKIWLAARN